MEILNIKIFSPKRNQIIFLFFLAFIFRIIVGFTFNPEYFPADGIGYYNIAVNAANGNGLSQKTEAPFIPMFSREPAYPVFLMAGLRLFGLFGGDFDYMYLDTYNLEDSTLSVIPASVKFLRIWQALFDSASVILIFLILIHVVNRDKAFFIAVLYALFLPVAAHCNILYREVFQTFILLLMNFFLIKYFFTRKTYFLVLTGFFWAASNMTLYATLALLPFIFLFILTESGSFKNAVTKTFIISFVMIVSVLPWYMYVYSYYPDIRIVKSGASAVTHEWRDYYSAHIKANEVGLISDSELRTFFHEKAYNRPYYEYFDKSFNGYYTSQADSLKKLIKASTQDISFGKKSLQTFLKYSKFSIKNFWIKRNWGYPPPLKIFDYYLNNRIFLPFILYAFSTLFAAICFLGFLRYWRKLWPILCIFISFLGISFIIGTEARRFLPAYPYVFTFGILMLIDIYDYLKMRSINSKSA